MTHATGAVVSHTPASRPVRCLVCHRFVPAHRVSDCPVCHADNTEWSSLTWRDGLRQFPVAAWAISILIMIAWLHVRSIAKYAINGAEGVWPALGIAGAAAFLLSLILMAGVFLLRFRLRSHELLRPFRRGKRRPSLTLMAVVCIIAACLTVAAMTAIAQRMTDLGGPGASSTALKTLFALLYAVGSPLMVLAAMLFGAKWFVHELAGRYPDPIYTSTERLSELLLPSIGAYLGRLRRPVGGAQPVGINRNRRGGLDLVVQQEVEVEKKTESGDVEYVPQTRTFTATSDEWGYILSFEEQKPKQKIVP